MRRVSRPGDPAHVLRRDPQSFRLKALIGSSSAAIAEMLESRMLLSLSPAGSEFGVNSFTTDLQVGAAVAMDGDGDFVAVWNSLGQQPGYGVFGQRYNASGDPQGAEFRASVAAGGQSHPAIAMDPDGDFVVTWQSNLQDGSGYGIFARRFNAAGVPQGGDFRVNTYTTNSQITPTVAIDAAGDFVIAWASSGQDGSGYGVYAQRYNLLGIAQGGEFHVSAATAQFQGEPRAAMDAWGDFVITWSSQNQDDGHSYGVYARRYDAAGAAQGGEFQVNTYSTNRQAEPAVAMDLAGDFVIAWTSSGQDGSSYGIYAQRFNSSGAAQGAEFKANTFTTGPQVEAALATDARGDFIIAWDSYQQDGSLDGVYAQQFDAVGGSIGSEFRVNTVTADIQAQPQIAIDAAGDAVISWQSNLQDGSTYGIYAQRYHESSDAAGPTVAGVFVNGVQATPYRVVPGPVTQVVISFSENVTDLGGATGASSVVNPANWHIVADAGGSASDVPISSITYLFNAAANRFQATLQLSGSFGSGDLQVQASDNIRDIAGNRLDGDFDGVAGNPFIITFGIGAMAPRGSDIFVNSGIQDGNPAPRVAIDPAGDSVVVWTSLDTPGTPFVYNIYAQRFNAAGVPQGAAFPVNTTTANDQNLPSVAMDARGDFVVAWQSYLQDGSGYGIYARRFNASGAPQSGEFRVNTFTTSNQNTPSIGMDSAGNFVIVWGSENQDGPGFGVYAQRYSSTGTALGGEFKVFGSETKAPVPAIAMDPSGDFVVAWQNYQSIGDGFNIFAQRYNASGTAQGSSFRVNTYTTNNQTSATAAIDNAGDFVITWTSSGEDGDADGVYAQRYNAAGMAQGGEFRVNTYTTAGQFSPVISMNPVSGDFVIDWRGAVQDGDKDGIFAQRFDASGTPLGNEFLVNAFTTGNQTNPWIAIDSSDEIIAVWSSSGENGPQSAQAQRFSYGAAPAVASVSDIPDPVTAGNSFTLTASGVSDDGAVTAIAFYREANGLPGLQFGSGGDQLVGTDTNAADGWAISVSTASLGGGEYLYYAQAIDNENLAGAPASTTSTVIGGPAPSVSASDFLFNTAPQRLSFTFDQNVSASLSLSDITIQDLTHGTTVTPGALSYNTSTNVATVSFSGILADANYRATLHAAGITNGGNTPMASDYVVDFFFLDGDANHDRIVDVTDLGILATNWQGSGRTFAQADFNYDGVVDVTDLGILATNWQKSVSTPIAAPAARTATFAASAPSAAPAADPIPSPRPRARRPTALSLARDVLG